MENDMSDIINKFNNILKDKNIDIKNIINDSNSKNAENTESSQNNFDFDITTLLKFKNIFDKVNNSNNPRNRLLFSLKPFLKDNKKEKLDQYIKIANILYVINTLNEANKGDDVS